VIVVTTGGRICVVEHVLGLALRKLNLSPSQLWREFGLIAAQTAAGPVETGPMQAGAIQTVAIQTGTARLDAQTDVFQLGVVALELLLGRRLSPLELKDRVPDLLDQWSEAATRAGLASARLRVWLERALQVGSRSYATAADAYSDLRDMPSESTASAFESLPMSDVDLTGGSFRSLQPARRATGQDSLMANATAPDDFPLINTPQPPRPFDAAQGKPFDAVQGKPFDGTQGKPFDIAQAKAALVPAERSWDMFVPEVKPAPAPPRLREPAPEPAAHAPSPATPAVTRKVTPPPAASSSVATTSKRRATFKAPAVSPWIAATLGVIALMEGVAIAALLMRQPANATPAITATVARITDSGWSSRFDAASRRARGRNCGSRAETSGAGRRSRPDQGRCEQTAVWRRAAGCAIRVEGATGRQSARLHRRRPNHCRGRDLST
jgi:hypothetical protein